jgi:hypothetical protein
MSLAYHECSPTELNADDVTGFNSGWELSLFVEIVAIYSREMTRFEEKPFNRASWRG